VCVKQCNTLLTKIDSWLPASTLNEREAPVNVHRRGFFAVPRIGLDVVWID